MGFDKYPVAFFRRMASCSILNRSTSQTDNNSSSTTTTTTADRGTSEVREVAQGPRALAARSDSLAWKEARAQRVAGSRVQIPLRSTPRAPGVGSRDMISSSVYLVRSATGDARRASPPQGPPGRAPEGPAGRGASEAKEIAIYARIEYIHARKPGHKVRLKVSRTSRRRVSGS